jgi:hypothetical protein
MKIYWRLMAKEEAAFSENLARTLEKMKRFKGYADYTSLAKLKRISQPLLRRRHPAKLPSGGTMQKRKLGNGKLEGSALGLGCMGMRYGLGPAKESYDRRQS